MPSDAIVDSGPLIALFDADDQHHDRAVDWFRGQRFAGHTTVAVLTEVSHMLRFDRQTQLDFWHWIQAGALDVTPLIREDLDRSIEVIEKYADLPAGFADATLVAIAERLGIARVASFDRDFDVYRFQNRTRFRNVIR